MRALIINADGYGFTDGATRGIDECVDFCPSSTTSRIAWSPAEPVRTRRSSRSDTQIACGLCPCP